MSHDVMHASATLRCGVNPYERRCQATASCAGRRGAEGTQRCTCMILAACTESAPRGGVVGGRKGEMASSAVWGREPCDDDMGLLIMAL